MKRFFIIIALLVFVFSGIAYADSTKEMPDHTLFTSIASDDTVWVYDLSASSLKRMTAENFIEGYLENPNGTLNISGASIYATSFSASAGAVAYDALDWSGTTLTYLAGVTDSVQSQLNTMLSDPNISGISNAGTWKVWYTDGDGIVQSLAIGDINKVFTSTGAASAPQWSTPSFAGGTGVTRFHGNTGVAESFNDGSGSAIFIVGSGGLTATSSGSTVTLTGTGFASQADLTAYTAASAFTGVTDFALDSEVTAYVTSHVIDQLTAYTDVSAFTGATDFATNAELTSHTEEVSGTSLTGTASIGVETTEVVYGGTSKYYVYSGTTLTGDMLAGGMIFVHTPLSGSTPTVVGVPSFSASTPYFGVWDMTGGGVTVQTTDGDTLYNESDAGTALFINAGNSRDSASFTCNAESGSCTYVVTLGTTGTWGSE